MIGSETDVALLAEGVDRNTEELAELIQAIAVALLAEGVDRNWFRILGTQQSQCRPPRGGRG